MTNAKLLSDFYVLPISLFQFSQVGRTALTAYESSASANRGHFRKFIFLIPLALLLMFLIHFFHFRKITLIRDDERFGIAINFGSNVKSKLRFLPVCVTVRSCQALSVEVSYQKLLFDSNTIYIKWFLHILLLNEQFPIIQ